MDLLRSFRVFVGRHLWVQAGCVAAFTFVIYAITQNEGNPFDQYVRLADAFLHGRLHIINAPEYLELARYDEKGFVIDPPAPTLFLMPFVAIFGLDTNFVLVSCGVGACAVGMTWVAARRFWTDVRFSAAMTILVGFGTNLWWASSDAGLWSFAHVACVFFLMAGLAEAGGRRRPWLIGFCLGLAGLSRLPSFLNAPLFLYLTFAGTDPHFSIREPLKNRWMSLEKIVSFGSFLGACALGYLTYNVARYGTFQDLGYYHPNYFREPWFQRGRFDITYIPRHFRAIFLEHPIRIDRFPFFQPKSGGTALVITTPAFLYSLRARLSTRTAVAAVTLFLVFIPLVLHGVTGWSQFGYRFALDALPSFLFLTASGMRERLNPLKVAVIAFCVLVNGWGAAIWSSSVG